ncbi:DUF2339 domain-containing protein [Nocardia rhizosphaerae]|uniref:DUF2339 domain-containing protein n=1 Tax=Nocardia rhizosphaerae TaxID=1691571 RepID=A0ABV8KZK3_9NOCA
MSTSIDPDLVARLSGEFTTLGAGMGRLGADLDLLRAQLQGETAQVNGGLGDVTAPADPASRRSVDTSGAMAGPRTKPERTDSAVPSGLGDRTVAQGGTPEPPSGGTQLVTGGQSGARDMSSGQARQLPNEVVPEGGAGRPVVTGPPVGGLGGAGSSSGMPAGAPFGPGGAAGLTPQGPWSGGAPIAPGGWGGAIAPGVPAHGRQPMGPVPQGGSYRPGYAGQPMAWGGGPGPRATRAPRTPWWQREGVISRALAVAGVGVTLIGVLMLLVLAAQAGFFGPVARVVAGGVFSAVLVGAGWRVFGRPGGRVGGIALVATGIAGGYLNVVAVTAYYHWVPAGIGLAAALAVALGGVGLAMRWQSQPLAVGVVLGAAVLSPVLTIELLLLGFLVVLQAAGVPVQLRRDWPVLHVARTLPVVLAALAMIALNGLAAALSGDEVVGRGGLLAAVVVSAVVGLVGAVLAVRRTTGDITASVTIALTALPVLAVAVLFDRVAAASITGVPAAVLLGIAATALVPAFAYRLPGHTTLVAALTGAVALLLTCVSGTGAAPRLLPTVLGAVALAFLAVAATTGTKVGAWLGLAFAALGGCVLMAMADPETLAQQRLADQRLDLATAVAAVLGLGVAAMVAWTVPRIPGWRDRTLVTVVWIAVSVGGLYSVLVAAVSLGVTLGAADGFVLGHSIATIVWMAAATVSLFYGLRRIGDAPAVAKVCLVAGLLVAAAALAKLFLFDLATLSGLVRVAAFLVVGILLLLTGTRYARAFADSAPGTRSSEAAGE